MNFQNLYIKTSIVYLIIFSFLIIFTRWGYLFIIYPHTPIYWNFDIGFHYLYSDYFRDRLTIPSNPIDISYGSTNGYFWYWWDSQYFANYMALADIFIGSLMIIGFKFIYSYAIITWIADILIMILLYSIINKLAGRLAAMIAAFIISINPLFIWGIYQLHVQISLGIVTLLGIIAACMYWDKTKDYKILPMVTLFAYASLFFHPFFMTIAVLIFIPYLSIFILTNLNQKDIIKKNLIFVLALFIGYVINIRFWSNYQTFAETTRAMIGRTDSWGQIFTPFFMIGADWDAINWKNFNIFHIISLIIFLVYIIIGMRELWKKESNGKYMRHLLLTSIVITILTFFVAYIINYNYWINRYIQWHYTLLSIPLSIGFGKMLHKKDKILKTIIVITLLIYLSSLIYTDMTLLSMQRSHGQAYEKFLDYAQQNKLPFILILYPGGTAITPLTSSLTETPSYDLSNFNTFLYHLKRYYNWNDNDPIYILWYSKISQMSRDKIKFSGIILNVTSDDGNVILGTSNISSIQKLIDTNR